MCYSLGFGADAFWIRAVFNTRQLPYQLLHVLQNPAVLLFVTYLPIWARGFAHLRRTASSRSSASLPFRLHTSCSSKMKSALIATGLASASAATMSFSEFMSAHGKTYA